MLSDVSIRQLMIWQDFNYSSIQCQVETPDIMKSGTYTQFYIQLIFAVKYREAIIEEYLEFLRDFDVDYNPDFLFISARRRYIADFSGIINI